jgi:hypothetical protein
VSSNGSDYLVASHNLFLTYRIRVSVVHP